MMLGLFDVPTPYRTRERIVGTRSDGSIDIIVPDERNIHYLMLGHKWPKHPWHGMPGYFLISQLSSKFRNYGLDTKLAVEWCEAMYGGGLTRAEAIDLIGRYTVAVNKLPLVNLEVFDVAEFPEDGTYRRAWRRSLNGGEIWVDELIAQKIDEQRNSNSCREEYDQ